MSNPWAAGLIGPAALVGRTISSFEAVPPVYGTTIRVLGLVTCTDGSRAALLMERPHGISEQMVTLIDSDGMRKAPLFFTDDEVAAQVKREMQIARQAKEDARRSKQREIERLQKELEA